MNSGASLFLNDVAGAWSSWMLGMAWIVAVLVVVLTLVTATLKSRSASLLYALWLLVLVRLVVPPEFAFPTGWGWWVRSEPAVASSATQPATAPHRESADSHDQSQPIAGDVGCELPISTSLPVGLILMIAWLGIVAARCGMLLTAALQVRVWVSRAHPILAPSLLDLLEECRERVGVRRRVELRNSEACSTPLVVGTWRPVLLLPSAVLERLSREQLRSVLIHELHHVRRWDGLVNLAQGLLGAVYFFHPAVWWANRRIRQVREDACDECTVAVLEGNRKPYGEAIFRVAEILGYSAPPLTLGVLDSKSPHTQRLRRILDPRLPIDGGRRWQTAFTLALAVAVLLPAGARPSSDRSKPSEDAIARSPLAQDFVRDLPVVDQGVSDVESSVALGTDAEAELLGALADADPTVRAAIYAMLGRVGTDRSLVPLQRTLLMSGPLEERQIRRALEEIYGRMQFPASMKEPNVNSFRIYEDNEQDDWGVGFP